MIEVFILVKLITQGCATTDCACQKIFSLEKVDDEIYNSYDLAKDALNKLPHGNYQIQKIFAI